MAINFVTHEDWRYRSDINWDTISDEEAEDQDFGLEYFEVIDALEEITDIKPWERRVVHILKKNNRLVEWVETFSTHWGWGKYDPILQEFVGHDELYEAYTS